MICKILDSIICSPGAMSNIGEKSRVRCFVCQSFVFSYLWGVGGNLRDASRDAFEMQVRDQFDDFPDARF